MPTKNGASTNGGTASASSLSWSHTVGSLTNGALIVDVNGYTGGGASTLTSVTWNGNAMTRVGRVVDSGGEIFAEKWILLSPSAGTGNVVITPAAASFMNGGAQSWDDINQVTPYGTWATNTGTDAAPTVNVTSVSGDIVNDVVTGFDAMSTANTQVWIDTAVSALRGGGSHKTAAGTTTTIAWTQASATNWSIGAVALKAAATYTLEQEGYRWRDDDGNETAATWLASQDSDITRATALNTRLRALINATDDPSSLTYQLEYKLSGGTYRKVEAAGGGSIAYGTQGANTTTGTTAPNVAYPASIAAGDLLILAVINRPNAQTPATPSGWTAGSNYTVTGGAGSEAADTGTIRVSVFTKEADGTESGNLTLSITSGTSCAALMWRATKTTGKDWSVALASGSDNSAGTSWSVTFGSDPGVTAGDLVFVVSGCCTDTPTWASESISQTGMTYGSMTERADFAVTTGNDLHLTMTEHAITSGTSSAAAVYTATTSGTNSANTAGASIMIRLRQVDQPIQLSLSSQFADGASTTAQLTAPSGKSTSDFVAGKLNESSNPAAAIDITADDYTEIEWCVIATASAANADVYLFRVTNSGAALNTYTVTPQWTIGSAGGDTLMGQALS